MSDYDHHQHSAKRPVDPDYKAYIDAATAPIPSKDLSKGDYIQIGPGDVNGFVDFVLPSPARASGDTPLEPGGLKYDGDKPVMALVPPRALEEEGKVWTFGAKKYAYWNWAKGIKYVRILSAILRHTMAIMRGEDRDPESGCLHAAHIRCCAGMLIEFHYSNRNELDDRYKA